MTTQPVLLVKTWISFTRVKGNDSSSPTSLYNTHTAPLQGSINPTLRIHRHPNHNPNPQTPSPKASLAPKLTYQTPQASSLEPFIHLTISKWLLCVVKFILAGHIKINRDLSMGNQSNSKSPAINTKTLYNPDLRDWKMIGEGDDYFIWKHSTTGEEMEEYVFTATDQAQFAHLKQVFELRFEKDYLVASKFFKESNTSEICSTFYQGHVFTERIPLRLNEIKDLPYPDTLHLLNACLRGFKELYLKVGSFTVSEHMIGINYDAKVKVWANSDFGKANHDGDFTVRRQDERLMVSELIEIIDKNCDHRTEPESLTQFISKNFSPNFDEALARLEEYTVRYRVSIPPILISIAQLRDRGYFKKMTPKGQSGNSIDSSQNRPSFPVASIPPPFSPVSTPSYLNNYEQPTGVNDEYPIPIPPPGMEGILKLDQAPTPPFNPEALLPLTTSPSSNVPLGPARIIRTAPPINNTVVRSQAPVVYGGSTGIRSLPIRINNSSNPITTVPNNSQLTYAHQAPKTLKQTSYPLVSIPSKIELTLTKITTNEPNNRIIENFCLDPNGIPPQTGTNLDAIIKHTMELERCLNQAADLNPSIVKRSVQKDHSYTPAFGGSFKGDGWGSVEGFTSPDLFKNYTNNYSSDSFGDSGRNKEDGFTDPALLSKAVSGVLNLLDAPSRSGEGFTNPSLLQGLKSSYTLPTSNSWESEQKLDAKTTDPSFLSKLTDFKSHNIASFSDSAYTFNDGRSDPSILTSLLVGGIVAAPDYKLKQLSGSSPEIMAMIKEGMKGTNTNFSTETARFGVREENEDEGYKIVER